MNLNDKLMLARAVGYTKFQPDESLPYPDPRILGALQNWNPETDDAQLMQVQRYCARRIKELYDDEPLEDFVISRDQFVYACRESCTKTLLTLAVELARLSNCVEMEEL